MGPGESAGAEITRTAEEHGRLIAEAGWHLLTGGRNAGVMHAASKGACLAGGTVVGILPGSSKDDMSEYVTLPIITGMGHARNVINILSSDAVVVCGMGPGTASEASIAIKSGKKVVFTCIDTENFSFFNRIAPTKCLQAESAAETITMLKSILK
jgi:uncharacterized protein (TIGR00725 family)